MQSFHYFINYPMCNWIGKTSFECLNIEEKKTVVTSGGNHATIDKFVRGISPDQKLSCGERALSWVGLGFSVSPSVLLGN